LNTSNNLKELSKLERLFSGCKRIAIVGVGNRLRGDDGVGSLVVEELSKYDLGDGVLALDCGLTPENYIGPLLRFKPECVIFVDATEMGEKPGTVKVLDMSNVRGLPISTHKVPLTLLAKFLRGNLNGVRLALIGIQPSLNKLDFKPGLSLEVKKSVDLVVKTLVKALFKSRKTPPPQQA